VSANYAKTIFKFVCFMMHINNHLKCPKCGRLKIIITPNFWDIQEAVCESCDHKITVHGGIPDFAERIPLVDPNLNPAQKLMNSRYFALVYESPIWRPLHTYIGSGISMSQEVSEVFEISRANQAHLVIDLACGTGHYARAFAETLPGAEVCGVDISLNMLTQARKLAHRKSLNQVVFIRGDIYQLPFDDQSVDWIHCGGALHLFPDLRPVWKEIARVMKPGGTFTAMTIALVSGLIGKVQQRIMDRGRATFFQPNKLAVDLNAAGLSSFVYKQHRVTLLFSTVKDSDETDFPLKKPIVATSDL
jgi:SAM-dependent methyltransferase